MVFIPKGIVGCVNFFQHLFGCSRPVEFVCVRNEQGRHGFFCHAVLLVSVGRSEIIQHVVLCKAESVSGTFGEILQRAEVVEREFKRLLLFVCQCLP